MTKPLEVHEYEQTNTRLGKNSVLKGTLRFATSVKISGNFEGAIESTGFLYIEHGAEVRADIKARSIVVGGLVRGNLEAAERVVMLPTGCIFGNVRAARLRIADGVLFEGKCEMIRHAEEVDIFSATVDHLKRSLRSV